MALLLNGDGLLCCLVRMDHGNSLGIEECPAIAGVAGGGALALLLAGAACLLYARTRRKMLWSETAGKRRLGQHPSGVPMQLQPHLMLPSCLGYKPVWHSEELSKDGIGLDRWMAEICGWRMCSGCMQCL